jgi:glutamyl-tRNA synthetase
VSSNPAVFDTEKLRWMNNHYVQQLDDDELAARCLHFLTEDGLTIDDLGVLRRAMPVVRERMRTLDEAPELLRFLFTDDLQPNDKARRILAKAPEGYLDRAAGALEELDVWESGRIQQALDELAEREGLNRTKAFQPVRAAVTASNVSPPLPESLELLGKPRTLARLRAAA